MLLLPCIAPKHSFPNIALIKTEMNALKLYIMWQTRALKASMHQNQRSFLLYRFHFFRSKLPKWLVVFNFVTHRVLQCCLSSPVSENCRPAGWKEHFYTFLWLTRKTNFAVWKYSPSQKQKTQTAMVWKLKESHLSILCTYTALKKVLLASYRQHVKHLTPGWLPEQVACLVNQPIKTSYTCVAL